MKIEDFHDLFPGEEGRTIREAISKVYANLMLRAKIVVVSISGGSDSDVMMDMIEALEPRKTFPNVELHYVWFDTGME